MYKVPTLFQKAKLLKEEPRGIFLTYSPSPTGVFSLSFFLTSHMCLNSTLTVPTIALVSH